MKNLQKLNRDTARTMDRTIQRIDDGPSNFDGHKYISK